MSEFVFEQLEPVGDFLSVNSTPTDRAAEIVAEAQARADEIEASARREGFEAGLAEGVARAEAEARQSLDAIAAAGEVVAAAREAAAAAVEQHAAELALLVAERIVTTAIEVNPELVCEIVASALRRVVGVERLSLDVNPDDVDRVRTWLENGNDARFATLEVRPERRVAPGGCVVRTAEVEIDARISEQIERAGELVRDALGTA
jgi:flagellar assembly protein FliH